MSGETARRSKAETGRESMEGLALYGERLEYVHPKAEAQFAGAKRRYPKRIVHSQVENIEETQAVLNNVLALTRSWNFRREPGDQTSLS
jgi:hypothetical protein